ncbi:MAG: glycosyltransferase family 9 protein [Elusimicrobia bacterium]|nr:glycosyltransferase family 9 protein [Elusimicrobiota bacterium]
MRVLIVKLAALGDVLRTASLLGPLRARYPGCEIWWATSAAARPLLEKHPAIHRLIEPRDLPRLPDKIRFDLVLSLEEDAQAAEWAAERCPGEFVGVYNERGALRYTESSGSYYDMSLLNRDADGSLRTANALKAKNRITYAGLWLRVLKLPAPKSRAALAPVLRLDARDRRDAVALARTHRLKPREAIGVNPGAGRRWPAKQLTPVRAARLLSALARGLKRPILLFGGRDEAARNADILEKTDAPVIDAGTRHGLREFAGLVELCGALVTTDSLALHVATAVRTPAVALVGPTSSAELDAFGRGKILQAKDCRCFYRPSCRLANSCLDRLTDAAIVGAVRRSLAS